MSQPYMLNIPLVEICHIYLSIYPSIHLSIYLSIYLLSIYIHIDGEINIDGIEWGYILKQY